MAIVRAAIPVVGVTWLRWPLAVVMFWFWLELALLAVDTVILLLRDGLAANLFETVLVLAACFVPLAFLTFVALQVFTSVATWAGAFAWLLDVLDTRSIRVAVALQALLAIVFAFVRSDVDGDGRWRPSDQLELLGNRLLVLVIAGAVVGGALALTGIGAPGSGKTTANTIAVCTVALVWLFGDATPARFNRFARLFRAAGKRKR